MHKLLLILPLFLLFTGCAQQTRGISPQTHTVSKYTPYSLEALDARYRQGGN